MADGLRSPAELGRNLDRIERDLHDNYVRRDVYQAALDRIAALEAKSNNVWLSNRNALLAVASVIVGLVWSAFIVKGGGH